MSAPRAAFEGPRNFTRVSFKPDLQHGMKRLDEFEDVAPRALALLGRRCHDVAGCEPRRAAARERGGCRPNRARVTPDENPIGLFVPII